MSNECNNTYFQYCVIKTRIGIIVQQHSCNCIRMVLSHLTFMCVILLNKLMVVGVIYVTGNNFVITIAENTRKWNIILSYIYRFYIIYKFYGFDMTRIKIAMWIHYFWFFINSMVKTKIFSCFRQYQKCQG